MSNIHDSKRRPEVGVKDMEKYEFGGLEVEERLTNGYLMYVPYGIHCDIFDAIEASNLLMMNEINQIQKSIDGLDGSVYSQTIKRMLEEKIEKLKKHSSVLEKITPIKHEI
ncbi:hypothetical protein CN553_12145 [Bacillus cereus]|uniref:Uncharacterized protein n=1 Tax=Bacillus cereus TaxID=1396 RepID=A0A9X6UC26_BACCE|nr:hypothetical protein [Bacillus cereus]PEN97795.1 hypothetical protein CN553_12145 [Bacillus cereus]